MPEKSVHCVVTSPPYWQLRDYFTEGQIGLEEDCQDYIDNLVSVFTEVQRVLRDDGSLWVVIGDTYSTPKKGNDQANINSESRRNSLHKQKINKKAPFGLPIKNVIGIPWRFAFAMQNKGWYWRSNITWHKENPTPQGVFDRPTDATEPILMFSKKDKYFYDYFAIMETSETRKKSTNKSARKFGANKQKGTFRNDQERVYRDTGKRNKRSVWKQPVASYKDPRKKHSQHFAVFPAKLIEPCILAGTSKYGCCSKCESPWKRIVEKVHDEEEDLLNLVDKGWQPTCKCIEERDTGGQDQAGNWINEYVTPEAVPCVVLDPFCGTSTTGAVALNHGKKYVGIDINPEYIEISKVRLDEIDVIDWK